MLGRTKKQGQTLIIALIVMGVMLIVGFIFLGLVSRNVNQTRDQRNRTLATDLAEAGVRYCHRQLLNSEEHADWRPLIDNNVSVNDVDYKYLRPSASATDLGGPDRRGAYTRVTFETGRALVRVRYEPADVFSTTPAGAIRSQSTFRNFIIVESVGRPGRVSATDPTLARNTQPEEHKTSAIVYLPTLSNARFISNANHVTRPADIGAANDMDIRYYGQTVVPSVEFGNALKVYDPGNPPTPDPTPQPAFGSIRVNGDVKIHGSVVAALSSTLGDVFAVSGSIVGDTDTDKLSITASKFNAGAWSSATTNLTNISTPSLNSGNSTFDTLGGILMDGGLTLDPNGYSRGTPVIEAPSAFRLDPDTGENPYVRMTRDSGYQGNTVKGNTGQYGYGRGVFIGNYSDLQTPNDETNRQAIGSLQSLYYDWLNPNNGQANSGWQGTYYIPRGAFLQLQKDGFSIRLDQRGNVSERTFRNIDGTDTGSTLCRFRLLPNPAGGWIILNSTLSADINAAAPNLANGQPFNGVLYFAGNVRVRGVEPTDVQLHVISAGSIYIEGSLTKGHYNGTAFVANTKSALALTAKQCVVLNTTMFNGPAGDAVVDPVRDVPNGVGQKPIRMAADGQLPLLAEFLQDSNAVLAGVWIPYSQNYREFDATDALTLGPDADMSNNNGVVINQSLMLSHTMDDGPGANAFVALDVNPLFGASTYNFPGGLPNAASTYPPYTASAFIPMWGLGIEPYQRYTKFETRLFPFIAYTGNFATSPSLAQAAGTGAWTALTQDTQTLRLSGTNVGSVSTNDYLLNHATMVPNDMRIEAHIYAEQGSWFVIPGPWFNNNEGDRRDVFNQAVATYGGWGSNAAVSRAQQDRINNFGNSPEVPFYGEPCDVRIRIEGSISENMPPSIAIQSEWMKKWGWIPHQSGCDFDLSGAQPRPVLIPKTHVPKGHGFDLRPATPTDPSTSPTRYVPNMLMSYDPMFATARVNGFDPNQGANPLVRTDINGNPLPVIPRLMVSPSIFYLGDTFK